MRIIAGSRIREYGKQYPIANDSLMSFLKVAGKADWQSIHDLRGVYPHADPVKIASGKIVTVINIKGNAFRLVVAVHYNTGMIFVLRFMTHDEYSKMFWKKTL